MFHRTKAGRLVVLLALTIAVASCGMTQADRPLIKNGPYAPYDPFQSSPEAKP
jgi:hypothetical protein